MKVNAMRQVQAQVRWDRDSIPAGESSVRHLLLEVIAPEQEETCMEDKPVNLALVIDRSGSMGGGDLVAACQAAVSIAETLGEKDRLSIVAFDHQVVVLEQGLAMDEIGKHKAMTAIAELRPGGSTNLSGGWFEGARCVSGVIETGFAEEGRVLILSDGHANNGICEPGQLMEHAREMAERGVMTSAVGIGDGYSPLQLDALAEGGRGRLHDAATPQEIVEVVTGELGELKAVTARNVRVTCQFPPGTAVEGLSRQSVDRNGGITTFSLGEIVGGAIRPLALRVEFPAHEKGEPLSIDFKISWRDPQAPDREQLLNLQVPVMVVSAQEAADSRVDFEVVQRIAGLWEATIAYHSMRDNEGRDFHGAESRYTKIEEHYWGLIKDLPDAMERLERFRLARERVAREWQGRSKRQAFTLSKKAMLFEKDLRKTDQGAWYDHVDEHRN